MFRGGEDIENSHSRNSKLTSQRVHVAVDVPSDLLILDLHFASLTPTLPLKFPHDTTDKFNHASSCEKEKNRQEGRLDFQEGESGPE